MKKGSNAAATGGTTISFASSWLITFPLTAECSAPDSYREAIHPFVGPVRLELSTLPLKAGYSKPIELRTILLRIPDLNADAAADTTISFASSWPASKAYETFELTITPNRNIGGPDWI
jgi:hypothetical protein